MKKTFLLLIASLILVACGGGGGGGSSSTDTTNPSVEYDMWDYIVSKTTITKKFDKYDTNSNYNPTGGVSLNAGQVRETVLSSDTIKYEEITNGTVVRTATFIVGSNTIQAVGGSAVLNRYMSLNSSFGDCIIKSHYANYSPVMGYNYKDVIEIKCTGVNSDYYSEFYAKDIGKITGQNHNSFTNGNNTTHYYSVAVADLQ